MSSERKYERAAGETEGGEKKIILLVVQSSALACSDTSKQLALNPRFIFFSAGCQRQPEHEFPCTPTPETQLISVRCHHRHAPSAAHPQPKASGQALAVAKSSHWKHGKGNERCSQVQEGGVSEGGLFHLSALHTAPSFLLLRSILWKQTQG